MIKYTVLKSSDIQDDDSSVARDFSGCGINTKHCQLCTNCEKTGLSTDADQVFLNFPYQEICNINLMM